MLIDAPVSQANATARDRSWLVLRYEVVLSVLFSGLAVFALVMFGVGSIDGDYGGAAALGVFCAMWGGPGFGVMVACSMHALRDEHEDEHDDLD